MCDARRATSLPRVVMAEMTEHPQRHANPRSMAYRVAALLLVTPIFLKIDRR